MFLRQGGVFVPSTFGERVSSSPMVPCVDSYAANEKRSCVTDVTSFWTDLTGLTLRYHSMSHVAGRLVGYVIRANDSHSFCQYLVEQQYHTTNNLHLDFLSKHNTLYPHHKRTSVIGKYAITTTPGTRSSFLKAQDLFNHAASLTSVPTTKQNIVIQNVTVQRNICCCKLLACLLVRLPLPTEQCHWQHHTY